MEEIMQDSNKNGIPDQFEYTEQADVDTFTPQGNAFDNAYENEEQIAQNIPDYKNYKWYKQPEEGYFYSMGEKIEDLIEQNPEESIETMKQIADANPNVSEEDIKPLVEEAEQITDSNPNNDEVNNQVVEEVTQKVYDDMPLDELEKADAAAIKGEGAYITVAQEMGLDENDLYYFEDPSFLESLTPEQKDEVKNEPDKKLKLAKLESFRELPIDNVSGVELDMSVLPNQSISGTEYEKTEDIKGSAPRPTIGHSFLGGGSSGSVSASGGSLDANIDNGTDAHSSPSSLEKDVEVEDANTGSTNSANNSEHIDEITDDLGFEQEKHEENIKSNEQAQLANGETWTENNDHFKLELPEKPNKNDIKEALLKDSETWNNGNSGSKYLPFRFVKDDDNILVSMIGTARKEDFDTFIKHEPGALSKLINLIK